MGIEISFTFYGDIKTKIYKKPVSLLSRNQNESERTVDRT